MKRAFFLINFLLLILACQSAYAEFKVHPRILVKEEYNDNIYLDENDEKNDFITSVIPGITATLTRKNFNLTLDYGFYFLKYARYSEEDETNIKDTQRGSLDFNLFPGKNFTVNVADEYSRVTIDERRPTVDENVSVNTTNRNFFHFSPSYLIPGFKTWDITIAYIYENTYYQEKAGDDSDSHSGRLDIVKRISPKLSLLGGAAVRAYQSETEPDYRRDDLTGGFSYQLSKRLHLTLTGGAAKIDYKNSDDNVNTSLFNSTLDYRYSEALDISMGYIKDFSDSVDRGLTKNQEAFLLVGYTRDISVSTRFFYDQVKYETEIREDRSKGVTLDCTIPMSHKRSIGFFGNYTIFKYLPEDDNVFRYSVGTSFKQGFRWLVAGIGASHYKTYNSSDVGDNYTNNIVYLTLAASF